MKTVIIILSIIVIISAAAYAVFLDNQNDAVDVRVFGGPGGTVRNSELLDNENPDYYLDYANHTGDIVAGIGTFDTLISRLHVNEYRTDLNVVGDANISRDLNVMGDGNFNRVLGIGNQGGTNPMLCFYSTGGDYCLELRTVGNRFYLGHGLTIDGTIEVDDLRTDSWRAAIGDFINYGDDNWSIIINDVEYFAINETDTNFATNVTIKGDTIMFGDLNVGGNIFSESGDINFVGDINFAEDVNFGANVRVADSVFVMGDVWINDSLFAGVIEDKFGLGGSFDLRGDPFAVQGVDFQVAEGFQVLGDSNFASLQAEDFFGIDANEVDMNRFGGADYANVQDWANLTQSAGLLIGGGITDNGDGTATVAAGSGFCKTVDLETAPVLFVSWEEDASVAFVDSDVAEEKNKVRIDCTTDPPTVVTGTVEPTHTTQFSIGSVWKETDDSLHILEGGTGLFNFARREQKRTRELRGIERVSGMITSEPANLKIAVTDGVFYAGLNRGTTDAFNSNTGGTFNYYFYSGSDWIKGDGNTQIDNTNYNDITTGLVELTPNRYGIAWVFVHHDSHIDVIYGQGNYTAAQAADVLLPASLPALTNGFATPIAKIILKKEAASFTSIETVQDTFFTKSLVDEHNDMGGIQGGAIDSYYHLDLPQHTELTTWLADVNLFAGGDLNLNNGDLNAQNLYIWGDANIANMTISGVTFNDGGISVAGDANFANVGVSEGTYLNRLNAVGDSNLAGASLMGKSLWNVNKIECDNCTASGENSIAFGNNTKASGANSIAFGGAATLASGAYSFAGGAASGATGHYSVALGQGTIASGLGSFSVGATQFDGGSPGAIIASGIGSFAWGADFQPFIPPSIEAAGAGSMAGGFNNDARIKADANGSIALGYADSNHFAGGKGSVVLGYDNKALGEASVALGKDVTCYNDNQVCVQDLNVLGDANIANMSISGVTFNEGGISVTGDSNFANIGFSNAFGTNIFATGNLSDGTNALTIANAKTAYDYSQIGHLSLAGGTMAGSIAMGDNSVTGIDNLVFTDTAGRIAGIENGDLLDKSATEVVSGEWLFNEDFKAGSGVANCTQITSNGEVIFVGDRAGLTYGSCYMNGGNWSSAAAQNSWCVVTDTDFTTGQTNNITHDGSGKFTILKRGIYKVDISLSIQSSTANKNVEIGFRYAGEEHKDIQVANEGIVPQELETANIEYNMSTTALLSFAANDTVELAVRTTDIGNPTLTVNNVTFNVTQIGGIAVEH